MLQNRTSGQIDYLESTPLINGDYLGISGIVNLKSKQSLKRKTIGGIEFGAANQTGGGDSSGSVGSANVEKESEDDSNDSDKGRNLDNTKKGKVENEEQI